MNQNLSIAIHLAGQPSQATSVKLWRGTLIKQSLGNYEEYYDSPG